MTLTRREPLRALAGVLIGRYLSGKLQAQFAGSSRPDEEMEKFLRAGTITAEEAIDHGVTKPVKVTLRAGTLQHAAQVQTVQKILPPFFGADNKPVTSEDNWRFNVAAYRLDRLLDLRMVAVAIARPYKGKPAAYSWWVDDVMFEEADRLKKGIEPPDPENLARQKDVSRVFDELIINIDRNHSNLLITKSWNLALIDHSRAFNIYAGIRNKENLTRCSRKLMASLRVLTAASVAQACGEHLKKAEVSAVLARRDRIVEFFESACKEKGEETVLFP